MKAIIIEDEYPNAQRLQKLLGEIDNGIEVLKILDGVENALKYIRANQKIDLMFLDIQLTDGIGLDILERSEREIPVIITTAYDQYALDAFKFLSIDYLLKPIKEEDLRRSLNKYQQNFKNKPNFSFPIDQLRSFFKSDSYKSMLIGRRGKNHYPIKTDHIAYCFVEARETWIRTFEGKEYLVQKTLERLEEVLNPKNFFRANRKIICAKNAIERFEIIAKSKIKLAIEPSPPFDIIISSEKSASFKQWIGEK